MSRTDKSVTSHRRRRHPAVVFFRTFGLGLIVLVAIMWVTGDWSVLSRLGIHQSVPAQVASPLQTNVAVSPLPQAAVKPSDVVAPGMPESITFRRGDQLLFSCTVRLYTPEGSFIDPKGEGSNDAFLIDPNNSQHVPYTLVGSTQGTAFIIGHRSEWQDKFCFNPLVNVLQGDLIDVKVPDGIVTCVAGPRQLHTKGRWSPSPKQINVLEVVACQNDSTNLEIRAECISSKKTV